MDQKTVIVGLGHQLRNGKDTAADAIVAAYPLFAKKYAFADALKFEISQMAADAGSMQALFEEFTFPEWVRYEEAADMSDPLCPFGKQRTLLQHWGEFRRSQDPLYWVNKLSHKIAEEKPYAAIISDMRYKNEFWWVKQGGGATVNVVRLGMPSLSSHISEHDLDGAPYDYVLAAGEGDVAGLKDGAVRIFGKILGKIKEEPLLAPLARP